MAIICGVFILCQTPHISFFFFFYLILTAISGDGEKDTVRLRGLSNVSQLISNNNDGIASTD